MKNMKKIIIPLIAVVVIAAVTYALTQSKFKTAPAGQKIPDYTQQTSKTFDPKNPNFVLGNITKVSATQIDFTAGAQSFSAQISSQTKLVKQVKASKLIKVVDAAISDFKNNQQIVVYFSNTPQNGVYQADKIQIISQ
jgi:radical SAM superfamily enzyme with C-terminal helix-hairpin-helix motif